MKSLGSQADLQDMRWLREAITSRVTVMVNARTDKGWMMLRSRFLTCDELNTTLSIERPRTSHNSKAALARGQNVGLSFRHGHKKCVFETEVLESGSIERNEPITLAWPAEIDQLQRRLYVRTEVPSQMTIPVDIRHRNNVSENPHQDKASRGVMLDLSAAGMSIALRETKTSRWRVGQTVTCAFALGQENRPWELTGQLRHCEKSSQGHLRVGLQFVGLDTSVKGCQILRQIGQAAGRFRQMSNRRHPGRLS